MNKEIITKLDKAFQGDIIGRNGSIYYVREHGEALLANSNKITNIIFDTFLGIAESVFFVSHDEQETRVYSDSFKKAILESMVIFFNYADRFESKCGTIYIKNKAYPFFKRLLQEIKSDTNALSNNCVFLPILAELNNKICVESLVEIVKDEGLIKAIIEKNNTYSYNNPLNLFKESFALMAYKEEFFVDSIKGLVILSKHFKTNNGSNDCLDEVLNIINPLLPRTTCSPKTIPRKITSALKEYKYERHYILYHLITHSGWYYILGSGPRWSNNDRIEELKNALKNGKRVEKNVYKDSILFYANKYIEESKTLEYVFELIKMIPFFYGNLTDNVRQAFNSKTLLGLSDSNKNRIWQELVVVKPHIEDEGMNSIVTDIIKRYEPQDLVWKNVLLFDKEDYELISDVDDYENNVNALKEKRILALNEIFQKKGKEGVIELIDKVKRQDDLVIALCETVEAKIFEEDIGRFLLVHGNRFEFVKRYINYMTQKIGVEKWLQNIKYDLLPKRIRKKVLLWSSPSIALWKIVESEGFSKEYWKKVSILSYVRRTKNELEAIIEQFNKNGRFVESFDFVYYSLVKNKRINVELIYKTMLGYPDDKDSLNNYGKTSMILETIRYLQVHNNNEEENAEIEKRFILTFSRIREDVYPENIIKRIEKDPELFCRINNDKTYDSYAKYKLLHKFRFVPGRAVCGRITETQLEKWIDVVEREYKNDHRQLAYIQETIGENLIGEEIRHPQDNTIILDFLNEEKNVNYRHGFEMGTINQRSCFTVDEELREQKELFELWNNEAGRLEEKGLENVAKSFRRIAENYKFEEDIIKESVKNRNNGVTHSAVL